MESLAEQPEVSLTIKSTNVRIRVARLFFKVLAFFSPRFAGWLLARLFLGARRFKTPDRKRSWMADCKRFEVESGAHRLAAWARGEGPTVLLAHGWEGRGSQLGAFMEPLVTAGFRVVTFDAPGHGGSTGRASSMPEMSQAILDLGRVEGPFSAVIAHSAGSAAVTVAVKWGLEVDRLVYISPPFDPAAYLAALANLLGLPNAVARHARASIERRFGLPMATFSASSSARSMTHPLLAIHDEGDREVPLEQVRRLIEIWAGADLMVTSGLGHRRILRDVTVLKRVVEELTSEAEARLEAGPLRMTQERIPA